MNADLRHFIVPMGDLRRRSLGKKQTCTKEWEDLRHCDGRLPMKQLCHPRHHP